MKCTNLIEFALTFCDEAQASASVTETPEQTANLLAPLSVERDINALRRNALSLENYNLIACNRGLTPYQETRHENLQTAIRSICEKYGIEPVFQGDPRGPAFGILCPNTQRYNSWGGQESGFRMIFEGK